MRIFAPLSQVRKEVYQTPEKRKMDAFPAMPENWNAIYTDLPSYPAATLEVTIDNGSASAIVGELIVGKVKTIGTAKYGVGVSLIDFSQKEADDFGIDVELLEGDRKRANHTIVLRRVHGVRMAGPGKRAGHRRPVAPELPARSHHARRTGHGTSATGPASRPRWWMSAMCPRFRRIRTQPC